MKRIIIPGLAGVAALFLLTGCLALDIGGGSSSKSQAPTLGQQLMDLQKAKDAGAINEAEFQTQKAKLLANH